MSNVDLSARKSNVVYASRGADHDDQSKAFFR